jgi:hypothetical protein
MLLALLVAPAIANANDLSFGPTGPGSTTAVAVLQPGLAGQSVSINLTGTDFYTDSNLRMIINGGVGPAPAVSQVFNDPALAIPGANLVGSIWANGSAGIFGSPNGTTADSTGLVPVAFYVSAGATSQNVNGLHTLLTISTVGVAPGDYTFDITTSDLFNGLDENFEPIPVPLTFTAVTLRVVPEPSSIVMGLMAAAGMAAVVIRRRRNA